MSPKAAGIEARGCDRYHCLLVRGEGGNNSVQGSLCIGRILHGLCLLEQRLLVLEQADKALQVQQRLASNVLAFVPFGLFLPLLVKRMRAPGKILLLGFEFSLLVEIVQLFSKVGSFDVDDILLNTLGVVLGYAGFRFFQALRVHNSRKKVDHGTKE